MAVNQALTAPPGVPHAGSVLTAGEEPPEASPAPPADAAADVDAGRFNTSMSWWTRAWVALFVALAVGVVGTGVVIVRRALDHPVDPLALQQVSTSRLDALDPSFPGLTANGPDTSAMVGCEHVICASAARAFTPAAHTTAASVIATAAAWASLSGLGSKGQTVPTRVGCGALSYAPTTARACDLASYGVPGQIGEQVHVYAELAAGPGAGSSPGDYPVTDVGKRIVTAVYIQVLAFTPPP